MLAAAFGVIVVDGFRRVGWQRLAFNASVFALATAAAGVAYKLAGGVPGRLGLPHDLSAILTLLLVYRVVNLVPIAFMIALDARTRLWRVFRDAARVESATTAAEAGLGVAIAFCVLQNSWLLLALAPLALAVYQAHARLTTLRRETLHALETFANIVDERDPHTYRHSARVAERVLALASALHLPAAQRARLRLPRASTISARSPSTTTSSASRAASTPASGRRCAGTRGYRHGCSDASASHAKSRGSSSTTTSATSATANTVSRRSRSRTARTS
jgi:hypothetical protein